MVFRKVNFSLASSLKMTGAIALIAAAVVLPACSQPEVDEEVSEATQENVDTAELTNEVEQLVGETVTVRNEAAEMVGEYAFLLSADQLFGGEQILVINASEEGLYLVEGDDTQVQVTGEVRELSTAEIEQEFGLVLDPELFAEYEQKPAIIAQSVALAPDPADIANDPEQYYDKRIAVKGEVSESLDTNFISIENEAFLAGEDLLVLNPDEAMDFQTDEAVVMTGVLKPFVAAEFENDYNLSWDLDLKQKLEAEYETRPVFVADEVYPSAL